MSAGLAELAVLPGVAAGLAVLVAGAGRGHRVGALAARRAPTGRDRSRRHATLAALCVGGGFAALAWGAAGPVLALALGAGLGAASRGRLVRDLGRGADVDAAALHAAAAVRDLPAALDLLAACLVSGSAPVAALTAVAQGCATPLRAHLAAMAHALSATGVVDSRGWPEPVVATWRIVRRAYISGAPAADSLERLAADLRARAVADLRSATGRLGVRAVLPLGLCFLPAFVLVGVVPVAVGLARLGW